MSALPPPPPPPPPVHGAPPARSRALVALGVVTGGLVVLGLVAGVTRLLAPDGPDHPDEWDPRVLELVAFVEQARGLDFDHPVHVDFLTASEYTELTTNDEDSPTDGDREDLDRYAAQLRSLGVASGELDLFAAFNQLADAGTLAYYDPDDARVRVRGTSMTVGLEVTLVHELTHALQDQHFDLGRRLADAVDADEGDEGDAASAFRALVEGDAARVEDDYINELTDERRAEYDAEYAQDLEESEALTEDVPVFVSASFAAPYALGQPFATMLLNIDGNAEVDAAFADPPTTEEHLLDPVSFLAGDGAAEDIDLGFPDDEELLDESAFGATTWYLVLAERIDPKQAFEAALGWGGGRFASVEREGVTCVRASFVGDTADDEDQMAAALEAWLAAMPGEAARLESVGGHPVLEACDPGADVDLELTGRSEDALFLPNLWGYLTADASAALDPEGARCYGRRVLDGLTYEQITDPDGGTFAGEAFQDRLRAAFAACQ